MTCTTPRAIAEQQKRALYQANIYARLCAGPAMNYELTSRPDLYGCNPRARVSDLRKLGAGIVVVRGEYRLIRRLPGDRPVQLRLLP